MHNPFPFIIRDLLLSQSRPSARCCNGNAAWERKSERGLATSPKTKLTAIRMMLSFDAVDDFKGFQASGSVDRSSLTFSLATVLLIGL